jgi:hypothetical protein
MIGPFGAMYRLDLYLNQRLTFIGSSRFIAAIHIVIYLALIGSAAEIAHFLWPRSHQVVWITNNWCWLPIPIEFATCCTRCVGTCLNVAHPSRPQVETNCLSETTTPVFAR